MNTRGTKIEDDDFHAYVDGVLPEYRRETIEFLLHENPAAAVRVDDYFSLNSLLHKRYDPILAEPLPARFRELLQDPTPKWFRLPAANWPRFSALAAMLTLGIGIGFGVQSGMGTGGSASGSGTRASSLHDVRYSGHDSGDSFVRKAALAHVVYMPEVEIPKTGAGIKDLDFVKWLTSRMGTDVRPPNLEQSGFQLAGGRLLPDADGSMAQFMYRNAQGERVTLCVSRRKASSNTTAFRLYEDGPVKVFYWIDGQYGYAVSAGIERATLLRLSHDVYAQFTPVSE
ncbi:anti-sigma factor [Paraburkholderia sp. RL18-103-BIB-C]|jgi:anti-sigma factor RsiW|uniref:anti-sigma factor family protein n=2 Tax=unclassified Paraburkholderia TaxID=2615204 RepID=UPI0038B748EE